MTPNTFALCSVIYVNWIHSCDVGYGSFGYNKYFTVPVALVAFLHYTLTGADPGFFSGGGAPVRNGITNTNKPHFFGRILVALESRRPSQGGLRTPCSLPLDPSLIKDVFNFAYTSKRTRIFPQTFSWIDFFIEFICCSSLSKIDLVTNFFISWWILWQRYLERLFKILQF